MRATSKQDLHDFPDLSPLSAAQLLINAKDYGNHCNHHCKLVVLHVCHSLHEHYFVFATLGLWLPQVRDLWNCSNFHFLRVIGVDG